MKQKTSIVVAFFLIMATSIYAMGAADNNSYEKLKVVGMNTVLGAVENPDVFFEGTYFEDIKPTKVLDGKTEYDRITEHKNATEYQNITDFDPKNPKSRVRIYKVKKTVSGYTFWFSCDSEEPGSEKRYKGETFFSNKKKLENDANEIDKKKSISAIKKLIKIYDVFTKTEFENISKKLLQETEDFIETIVLMDGCYMCVIFRKM